MREEEEVARTRKRALRGGPDQRQKGKEAQPTPTVTEVRFDAGQHVSGAAARLVEVAERDGAAFGHFNEIQLQAVRGGAIAESIVADYDRLCAERSAAWRASPEGQKAEQERQERRQHLQGVHDALMARLPTIWGDQAAILDWLCEMQGPSDHVGVIVRKDTIGAAFAKHNYVPGMDCGEEYKADQKNSAWRYLVGQALDGIVNGPAIHSILHKFADEWRARWIAKAST